MKKIISILVSAAFLVPVASAQTNTKNQPTENDLIRFIDAIDLTKPYKEIRQMVKTSFKCKVFDNKKNGFSEPNDGFSFTDSTLSSCRGISNYFELTSDKQHIDSFYFKIPHNISKGEFIDRLEDKYGKGKALPQSKKVFNDGTQIIVLENDEYTIRPPYNTKRKIPEGIFSYPASLTDIIPYLADHLIPGESTRTEVENSLKPLGCKLVRHQDNSPEYKLTDGRDVCMGVDIRLYFKEDDKKILDFISIPVSRHESQKINDALEARYGEPISTERGKHSVYDDSFSFYTFQAGRLAISNKKDVSYSDGLLYLENKALFADQFEERERQEKESAERERQRLEAEARLQADIEAARKVADQYKGKLFGIVTPGETSYPLLVAKLETLGCKIQESDNLAVTADGLKHCFTLPGNASLSFGFNDGVVSRVMLQVRDADAVNTFKRKFRQQFGRPTAMDMTDEAKNIFEAMLFEKFGEAQKWQGDGIVVYERAFINAVIPNGEGIQTYAAFTFVSNLEEKEKAEAERRRQAEEAQQKRRQMNTLENMF